MRRHSVTIGLALLSLPLLVSPIPAYANIIWPAVYFAKGHVVFWYVVAATVFIEAGVLQYSLSLSYLKAFCISCVGNFVSGVIGTFLMVFVMMEWHSAFDKDFLHTFSLPNIVATAVLMLGMSVLLEVLTVQCFFNFSIRKIVLPLAIGNAITYAFILLRVFIIPLL